MPNSATVAQTMDKEQGAAAHAGASTSLAEQRQGAAVVMPAARPVKATAAMVDSSLGSIRYSDDLMNIAMALSQAQGEFQEIEKKRQAKVTSRREGAQSYTYWYSDLADVLNATRPALSKYQIALLQFPRVQNKLATVTTVLIHSSGEWIAGDSLPVALDNFDPQAGGSAQTYARRYGLCSMLGLAPGDMDDDGKKAAEKSSQTVEAPDGFEATWIDMIAKADEGWPALEATWAACNGAFKNYVARHKVDQWNELRAKAKAVAK